MSKQFNLNSVSCAVKWVLCGLMLTGHVAAQAPKDPELYKQELLAIEKRLDAKLKELDEKLERLEKLESATATVAAPARSDDAVPVKAEETLPVQTAEEKESDRGEVPVSVTARTGLNSEPIMTGSR
jgi:phosphate-selective porin OprO and OprP